MSEFVDIVKPLHDRLKFYDRTRSPNDQPNNDAADPVRACPQTFIDAMSVREEVYVKEQKVALENELDDDDPRSFHWVAYASIPMSSNSNTANSSDNRKRSGSSSKIPIGTIRLVPPPHTDHHSPPIDTAIDNIADSKESYAKIGRLAVIKEFRKAGISKLLIETALAYASEYPQDLDGPQPDPMSIETAQKGTAATSFRGLVLVHSQVGVQKVWARYGFQLDEAMGTWDEEGIDHVGMWKRVSVAAGRSKSKVWLGGSTPLKP